MTANPTLPLEPSLAVLEAMARAICRSAGYNPDTTPGGRAIERWRSWQSVARAACANSKNQS